MRTISATPRTDGDPLQLEAWAARTAPAGYRFDERAAARAVAFFPKYLKHTKGKWAGKPFDLDPWQTALVRCVFGWKRPDGTRRFRLVYCEVARKNGKTGLAAGIALLLTYADGEAGAEVYSAANDTDQAMICFTEAVRMRAASPALREQSMAYKKALVVPKTASSYKVLSSDAGTKDGLNASGIIFDELHASRDRALYDVLHTSTGARAQPLEFLITTAGTDRHSICYEMREYAEKVRDGIIDDPDFLPVIYCADRDDDFTSPATWAKANPGLGKTVALEYIAKEAEKARLLPRYENTFKRLHLNIWTEQVTRWLPMDAWDDGGAPFDPAILRGRECYAGLDLASTTDVAALGLVFPDEDDNTRFDVVMRFWVPERNAQRRAERDRVPYPEWIRQGWIKATEGDVVDYDVIRADVNALHEIYRIRELAIDRWNATQITTQLQGDGFTMVPFGQGFGSMSAPSKELEKLVLGRQLRHGGNPVLRWMASNVAVAEDAAGNIKPAKDKSTEKIDGIVALIMALGRATVRVEDPGKALERRILERGGFGFV